MTVKEEIESALKAADERLDALTDSMSARQDARLVDDDGKWSVRDCLSHVAATARVSGGAMRALSRARGEGEPAPAPTSTPAPSVDERNQMQIEERASKSVEELVAEIKAGHALAWSDVQALDEEALGTDVQGVTVGAMVLRSLQGHEGGQVDRIEAALRA